MKPRGGPKAETELKYFFVRRNFHFSFITFP